MLVALSGLTAALMQQHNPFVGDDGSQMQPLEIEEGLFPSHVKSFGLKIGDEYRPYDSQKQLLQDFIAGSFAKGMGLQSFRGIPARAKLVLNGETLGWKPSKVERNNYGLRAENFSKYFNNFKYEATKEIIDFANLVAADTKAIADKMFVNAPQPTTEAETVEAEVVEVN